jgi:aminoglycoside phosphotransferase (APT) family kinase protein
MGTPAADIHVDEPLVTALLAAQCPELAALPVRIVGNGWDNTIARVGDDWMVRVPRREAAAALLFNEQTWLPLLAPSLPLPVPVPWFCGVPDDAFPWAWSVCRWLPGRTTAEAPPADPAETARTLAGFIAALHQPAPPDAPLNPFRGVALAERAAAVQARVAALGDAVDAPRVLRVWAELQATPAWGGPPLWLHGDLHPSNMLTLDGRLSAVIDFGDLCAGDPATDLAVAWMMFPAAERTLFRNLAGVDDNTWRRAGGWALNLSLAYLTGDDSTSMPAIGRHTLAAVLTEFA